MAACALNPDVNFLLVAFISTVKSSSFYCLTRGLIFGEYYTHPYTLDDAKGFLQIFSDQDPVTFFGIDYCGEYVGNISLVMGQDIYRKSAEIGYFLGEPYWNKGIASEAVKLITGYGFNTLGIIRIHTGIFEYNTASMRVLEKCGFEKEGIFRKSIFKQNKIWDEIRYAKINPLFDKG